MGDGVASEQLVVLGVVSVTQFVVFRGVLGIQCGKADLVTVLEQVVEAQQACQVQAVLVAVVGELVHVLALGIDVGDVCVVDVLASAGDGRRCQQAQLVTVAELECAASRYRAGDVGDGHRLADVKCGSERVVLYDVGSEVGQAHVPDVVRDIVVVQQPALSVGTVCVCKCSADGSVQTEGYRDEALSDIFLGGDVDMGT